MIHGNEIGALIGAVHDAEPGQNRWPETVAAIQRTIDTEASDPFQRDTAMAMRYRDFVAQSDSPDAAIDTRAPYVERGPLIQVYVGGRQIPYAHPRGLGIGMAATLFTTGGHSGTPPPMPCQNSSREGHISNESNANSLA